MSWLQEFRSQLTDIQNQASATKNKTPYDIANAVTGGARTPHAVAATSSAARPYKTEDKQWNQYNFAEKLLHSEAAANVLGAEPVRNAIDFISRPGYAVNSLWAEGIKQDNQHPGAYMPDFGKLGDALHKGWTGETPTTGNDIVNAYVKDNSPGKDDAGDWIRALSGFGVSVASDPLTYLGPGAIKGAVKGVGKATGIAGKIPKAVTNEVHVETVLNPIPKAVDELAQTGSTTVPTNIADELVAKSGAASPDVNLQAVRKKIEDNTIGLPGVAKRPVGAPSSVLPGMSAKELAGTVGADLKTNPVGIGPVAEIAPSTDWMQSLPFEASTKQGTTSAKMQKMLLDAQKNSQKSILEGVPGRKYNASDITAPFKNIAQATEEIPGKPVSQAIRENAAKRIIMEHPTKFGLEETADGGFIRAIDKTPLSQDELRQAGKQLAAGKNKTWENLPISTYVGDAKHSINVHDYMRALTSGGKETGKYEIGVNGEWMPLSKYAAAKHTEFSYNEVVGGGTRVTQAASTIKFSDAERAAWKTQLSKVLAPEDLKYLSSGTANEKSFATRLNKVLGKVSRHNYDDLDAAEAAFNAGNMTKAHFDRILSTFGPKVKTIAGAKKAAAELDSRIAKLDEKMAASEAKGVKAEPATIAPEPPVKPTGVPTEPYPTMENILDNAPGKFDRTPMNPADDPFAIEPASSIIDKARMGDTKIIDEAAGTPAALSPVQAKGVMEAIDATLKREFTQLKDYKYRTTVQGTKRTSKTAGEGLGRNEKGFNRFSAYTLHKNLINKAAAGLRDRFPVGAKVPRAEFTAYSRARAAAMYDEYMPMLKASEDTLKTHGIEPNLGQGHTGLPLSLHDVLSTLDRNFVEKYVMNLGKNIGPTQLMDMAEIAVQGVAKGSIDTIALDSALGSRFGEELSRFNNIVSKGASKEGIAGKASAAEPIRVVQTFVRNAPALAQRVEVNSARLGIEFGQDTKAIEMRAVKKFAEDLVEHTNQPSSILTMVEKMDDYISGAVKDMGKLPIEGAAGVAAAGLKDSAASGLALAQLQVEVKASRAMADALEAGSSAKIAAVGVKTLESALDDTAAMAETVVRNMDLSEHMVMSGMYRMIRGIAPHVGNDSLRTLLLMDEVTVGRLAGEQAKMLKTIGDKWTKPQLVEAFHNIQTGAEATTPEMKAIMDDMTQAVQFAFDPAVSETTGVMTRLGIDPQRVNDKFAHFGIGDKFRLKGKNREEFMQSWKNWTDVKDPLDMLSRSYAAVMATHAENLLGQQISHLFGKAEAFEGSVKVLNKDGNSLVHTLIDSELHYPEDVARQMYVLDHTLRELRKPPSSNKMLRLYDSVIHSYKTQLTIYRPGHHMRNMYGDIWLGAMDGMTNPMWYKKGLAVMAQRPKNYSDWNMDGLSTELRGQGKTAMTFKHNGKDVPVSYEDMYRLGLHNGIFQNYTVVEDINMAADTINFTQSGISGKLSNVNPMKLADKMTGGKVKTGDLHRAAANVSELRDHYVRVAHFMYALNQDSKILDKGMSVEQALSDAAIKASARVRKWHPDGSDYSQFEKTAMRRTILFYSWMRKAIPLVLESHMLTPGRALVYPKGMYALAESQGIDLSGHGYGDPFPDDQLFPSWMKDSFLGPSTGSASSGYFGLKPGVPGTDVLESYFNTKDPGTNMKTILSGTTPAMKIPWEIGQAQQGAVAQDSRTGAPVKTWTDYIGNQLPNVSLATNLTGMDLPGSSPGSKLNEGYTPELQVPGTPATLDKRGIAVANWLTGLGITDMSKPSYINSAQREASRAKVKK